MKLVLKDKTVLTEKDQKVKNKKQEKNHQLMVQKRQQKEEDAIKRISKRQHKVFPSISVLNPFLLKVMRQNLKHKYIYIFKRKQAEIRNKIAPCVSSEDSAPSESESSSSSNHEGSEDNPMDYTLPKNSQNRVGRWTHHELANLKLAMAIFGDQSWKKIQKFLVQNEKESKKSKTIKKAEFTYRSVKAIQSKIYQIKPRVESELDHIK